MKFWTPFNSLNRNAQASLVAATALAAHGASARSAMARRIIMPRIGRRSKRCERTEFFHHGLIERLAVEPRTAVFQHNTLLGNPADDLRIDHVLARVHALGKRLLGVARHNGDSGLQDDGP